MPALHEPREKTTAKMGKKKMMAKS